MLKSTFYFLLNVFGFACLGLLWAGLPLGFLQGWASDDWRASGTGFVLYGAIGLVIGLVLGTVRSWMISGKLSKVALVHTIALLVLVATVALRIAADRKEEPSMTNKAQAGEGARIKAQEPVYFSDRDIAEDILGSTDLNQVTESDTSIIADALRSHFKIPQDQGIIFIGIPTTKTEETETETKRTPIEAGIESACVITKRGDTFYWASREGKVMKPTSHGFYITYNAYDGAGYLRFDNPDTVGLLGEISGEEHKTQYTEHMLLGLATITYRGEVLFPVYEKSDE